MAENEDRKKAQERRDLGMDRSIGRCGTVWKRYAIRFLEAYCRKHPTVFVDDLWATGLEKPESARGLGAVMTHAKRAGWIAIRTHDGCVLSLPSINSNQQLKPVWQSLIFGQQPAHEGPRCDSMGQGDLF